jgi:hypothetical protein
LIFSKVTTINRDWNRLFNLLQAEKGRREVHVLLTVSPAALQVCTTAKPEERRREGKKVRRGEVIRRQETRNRSNEVSPA